MRPLRAVSLVLASLLACGPAAVSAGAQAADERPGALGTIAVPGGADALAAAVGLTVPASRATVAVDVVRRLQTADGNAAALAQRRRAVEAIFDGAAAGAAGETIPLPFTEDIWARALFNRRIPAGGLARAIFTTPRASLVYHGAVGLDDATRAWFAARPYRLLRIGLTAPAAFAAFGPSLRIDGARLASPGGAAADAVWEALVGASPAEPDAFVSRLFEKSEGRLAWLYDALSRLDAGQQRHLLTGEDAAKRLRRLADVFERVSPEWRIADRPFWRPRVDPAALLVEIPATSEGVPAVPLTPTAWSRTLGDDAHMDVAWLATRVFLEGTARVRDRFELVLFSSRWQQAAGAAPPAAALELFDRAPVLALTLERLGVRDEALAARLLAFITGPVPKRDAHTVRLLQASLALVERATLAGSLDAAAAGRVTAALIDRLEAEGAGRGVAAWLTEALLPARGAVSTVPGDLEAQLVALLAGPSPAAPPAVEWEGQRYVVDAAAAERDRITRARTAQGEPRLTATEAAPLADGLISLVYAAALPTAEPELLASRAERRHSFGDGSRSATGSDPMWQTAEPASAAGVPWHLSGSLLALDVALAVPSLRRVSDDPPSPVLPPADRVAFARTVALSRAAAQTEASMAAVLRLVDAGRRRLAGLAGRPVDAEKAAAAAGLGSWRAQALVWTAVHQPAALDRTLSLSELAWLGEPGAGDRAALDAWGTSRLGTTGRLATAFPPRRPWEDAVTNDARGGLAASVADLNLRVAAFLAARRLPAALARDLLSAATLELVDWVAAPRSDDWRAVIDHISAIPDTRLEDYVAALTADGPLRPVRAPEGSR